MRHFGIYSDSSELEQAYQNGDIINPYVALVDGDLDYDTQQPCYLGEWSTGTSQYGKTGYTFQILDDSAASWPSGIQIGTLLGVYFNGGEEAIYMPVKMTFDGSYWSVEYAEPNESSNPSHQFEEGVQDNWACDEVMTDPSSSTAQIQVEWDGVDTFVFFQGAADAPALSMNTINPECSE